ncbi:hypothetical protein [Actinoplanes sp. G11-F43]|uniref:hypothetical protein n=1 Tax=Actinoplanes sp. G11-F43 TaxID=3424130 RepID=UPI003D351B92
MRSTLSLAVEELRVIVRIDGVDVSRAHGNDGVDPWHVLVPVNRFVATGEPTATLLAGCRGCGPDCFAVEARVRREDDTVRWEWDGGTALFDAHAYDAEVARFAADHGWETGPRRAGRLILTDLPLPPGLTGVRVTVDGGDLEIWLEEPGEYQIFVRVPWDEQHPDECAAAARSTLTGPASRWPATWHSIRADRETPPAYADPAWQRSDLL